MENKINIAELLKDCPKGMELNCTMYDNVEFDYIEQNSELVYPIHCLMKINGGYNALVFTRNGCNDMHPNAKCVIFPKGKTSWEGFQRPFKDGDILTYTNNHTTTFIYRKKDNEPNFSTSFYVACNNAPYNNFLIYNKYSLIALNGNCDVRLATEEEKEKLFKAIKDNGYKWNPETKTLEKLVKPRFKVGDRIKAICNHFQYDIKELTDTHYTLEEVDYKFKYTEPISEDKNWELVPDIKPKFKVGDRIRKKGNNDYRLTTIESINNNYYVIKTPDWFDNCYITDKLYFSNQDNYELVLDKFDINTLKPFDKVLVRNTNKDYWMISMFGYISKGDKQYFMCIAKSGFYQCIPYEKNEHLLGTTNDCDDYFKTW